MSVQDEILRATGGPTVNDGLRTWFGATASETLQDAERRWLLAQPGAICGTINDLWMQTLSGTPGTLNDKVFTYWFNIP